MIGMTPDSLCSLMFLTLLIPNLVLAHLGKYLVVLVIGFSTLITHTQDVTYLGTMRYSKTQPPDFPPKGSGHVISNFLLSAGILAQYKTFHVSF